jgi:iron(III) transport system substrate-binding protein
MRFLRQIRESCQVSALALVAALSLPGLVLAQSLDELHKAALKEGGGLNFYGTLAQVNAEKILPVFEKRFPGIKINHVDATSDKLVARAVTEARGGKTLADVLQVPLENVTQAHDQGLLLDTNLPESADYPAGLKGAFWVSSDLQYLSLPGIPIW